ncbi:MAG TPA: histidine kinase [Flavipsychrobacter sp.]|nr:histidine kinase [Flavipsychrobacter sp.]
MISFKQWWAKSYDNGRERFVLHGLFWIVYLCFLSFTAYEHTGSTYRLSNLSVFLFWFFPVYLVWVFYLFINTAYAFFRKGLYLKTLFAGLISFLGYIYSDILFTYLLARQLTEQGIPSKFLNTSNFITFYQANFLSWFAVAHALFGFCIYLMIPILCKFFRDLQRSQIRYNELVERNMQLELSLVKSQMNPHFLLNTLNNIYGLTITGSKQQIGEMVLSLSGFLKYSLYECNHEFIPISKEITLIRNYIELETVRSDFIETSFEVSTDMDDYMIPPFLLFPLVENAFKHGARNLTESTRIDLHLSIARSMLKFTVKNELQVGESPKGGIGLPALRKKIEYYYPGKTILTSAQENGKYIAQLQIDAL